MGLEEMQKRLRVRFRIYPIGRECEKAVAEVGGKAREADVYAGIEGPVMKISEDKILTFGNGDAVVEGMMGRERGDGDDKIIDFSDAGVFSVDGGGESGGKADKEDILDAEVIYEPESKKKRMDRAGDMTDESFVYRDGTVIKVKRKGKSEEDEEDLFQL